MPVPSSPLAQLGGRKLLGVTTGVGAGSTDQKLYMIVGFEVVACSIERPPGQPFKNIACPQSPDDSHAPKAQEVTKGALQVPVFFFFGKGGEGGQGGAHAQGWAWLRAGRLLWSRQWVCEPALLWAPRVCLPGSADGDGFRGRTAVVVPHLPAIAAPFTRLPRASRQATPPHPPQPTGAKIAYTYDVYWDTSDITWASRWDAYLRMPGGRVHWFSIANSLMVVAVMSCIVALITLRTIRRDLAHYESLLVDGAPAGPGAPPADAEESGWKMVGGDVFRAPGDALALAVQVGSGVQILASATVTLLFASLGFLSPASRGSLLTAALAMYLLLSVAAGFSSVWLWGVCQRSHDGWHRVCWRVACYFPGVTVAALTVVNMFLWATSSAGTIPLGFFFSAIFLWLLVSIPLAYGGGALAARRPIPPWPSRTNQIPRHIPAPHWTSHPLVLFLAAGLLPFGTVFVELYFAMTSLWQGYFYYIFGFLAIVAVLTVLITVEVAVVCTYVQLCAEDYLWWWRSFYRGGSLALYVAVYSLGFLFNTLKHLSGFVPVVLYLSYMGLLVWCVFLASGTIGFLASYIFTVKIFESVKAD